MPAVSFDRACALLETALDGAARREIVAALSDAKDFGHALRRLRGAHAGPRVEGRRAGIDLDEVVAKYDRRTRQDGFHVLHDWDGKADHVNDDIIPVDVLDYLAAQRGARAAGRARARDPARLLLPAPPGAAARSVSGTTAIPTRTSIGSTRCFAQLQGPDGSGQRFVDDAETLILIATSHFEIVGAGIRRAARARADARTARTRLNDRAWPRRRAWAAICASASRRTYGRDTRGACATTTLPTIRGCVSRWSTVMREYARLREPASTTSRRADDRRRC